MSSLAAVKGTYVLDPAHSQVGFVARHALVTKVRGRFAVYSGSATLDGANPYASNLSVEVDAASVDTNSDGRDGHLKSADFFDVATHPRISFVSTGIDLDGDTALVNGDLTIKGVTRPVTIPFEYQGSAKDPFGNERIGFEGAVVVDRREWGLTWNAALEAGGVLVSEKVTLEFEVSAIKQAA